jgi:hypothetical protein
MRICGFYINRQVNILSHVCDEENVNVFMSVCIYDDDQFYFDVNDGSG